MARTLQALLLVKTKMMTNEANVLGGLLLIIGLAGLPVAVLAYVVSNLAWLGIKKLWKRL
jgi:hypothetical protein